MLTLSEDELLLAISAGEAFEAELEDGSLSLRIREYVPYLCTAIHAGHRLRAELSENCLLTNAERFSEEDPYTDQLIDSFPIVLVANDSRYEYDLNRDKNHCVYESAWGKDVWKKPLTASEKSKSLQKHERYFRVVKALLDTLEKKYGGALLVDVHSFNWQIRQHGRAPIFNIGTAQIDVKRWSKTLSTIEKHLSLIELPNLETEALRNAVFEGRGYQATFVRNNFNNTLLIPLEIKKIFMDEENGESFPLVLEKLQEGLYLAVHEAANTFNKTLKRSTLKRAD